MDEMHTVDSSRNRQGRPARAIRIVRAVALALMAGAVLLAAYLKVVIDTVGKEISTGSEAQVVIAVLRLACTAKGLEDVAHAEPDSLRGQYARYRSYRQLALKLHRDALAWISTGRIAPNETVG